MSIFGKTIWIHFLLIVLGAFLFLPGLGSVHLFDWDEINFAESAREMLVSGDYMTVRVNFEPFWEKPPLFIWLQAASMHIFGVNEFAARFPNAVCGILTLLFLFHIGRQSKDEKFGLLWILMYVCSFFPFFYFKSGIIDPWFNLFIFLGIYFFAIFINTSEKSYQKLSFSALFLGLAVLTKGPVALLIFGLSFFAYLLYKIIKKEVASIARIWKWKYILFFGLILVVVSCFWFILQMMLGNFTIIQDFIIYQIRLFQTKDAGHGGFLLYHFVILLIGVFPASILALPTFRRKVFKESTPSSMRDLFVWMMCSFWVVLLLFTIVKTKIIHYSSFCYFPLTFLAAWYVMQVFEGKAKIHLFQKILLLLIAGIYAIAVSAITTFDQWKTYLFDRVDEFTLGNLQATSSWWGFEFLIGAFFFATVIYFCVSVKKQPNWKSFGPLLGGSLFFIAVVMLFVVPQVEKYTQAAPIEFYKSKQGEDCYILPKHKSYAHYFYSQRRPENKMDNATYLMLGKLDKPCYFVLRNTKNEVQRFESQVIDAVKLYDKNGFSFYVRYSQNNK